MLFSSFSITGWFYFSAKLRTPFCNWVAKEGEGIATVKHGLKIQQSHAPERWPYSLRVRGPHFASKVSYNAGAATDDNASALPSYYFLANALLHSIASRLAFDCVSSHVRSCLGPRSLKSIGTETRKTLLRKKSVHQKNPMYTFIYISVAARNCAECRYGTNTFCPLTR
jgi:hypothetical protein